MMNNYKYIFLALLATVAISCNKSEIDGAGENEVSFKVRTGALADNLKVSTRGQRYNDETEFDTLSFGVYGWNSSNSDEVIFTNETVSKSGDKWVPETSTKWTIGKTFTFEAVYPQPTSPLGTVGLTALTTDANPANLTFSYKIPTATMATEDKDFMLAYYSGTGTNGSAALTFTHPLTCVNFKAGTMSGVSKINSISLAGVYESGDCTVRTATYGTDDLQCYSYEQDNSEHTSLWDADGSITVTGEYEVTASSLSTTIPEYNFLLIPQNTASQAVTMTINITDDDDLTYNISIGIDDIYWRAGYCYTYKIKYNAFYGLTLTLVAEDFNGGSWFTHGTNGTTAGQFQYENW